MAKPTGSICNIACQYCFYLEKENLYPERKNHWKMNDLTLENYIRKTIASQQAPVVEFIWQGGEPTLLGIDFFKKAIQLQNQLCKGKKIQNSLQTNGTRINEEWAEFLKENNFLVGISIDGDRVANDSFRKTKSGASTFDDVLNGIEWLKKYKVDFNTLTVVNAFNVDYPIETYHFLKCIGSRYIQFIPVVERQANQPDEHGLTLISPDFTGQSQVTNWSVDPDKYGEFLNRIFDDWLEHDLGSVFVMNFEQEMSQLIGRSNSCITAETCGQDLIIESNGDIYSCDHFVYPDYRLGNINQDDLLELVNSAQNERFRYTKKTNLSVDCLSCDIRSSCNGGCPKHRFVIASDGKPNHNYFCPAYKKHLHYVIPKMKIIIQGLQQQQPLKTIKKICMV